MGWTSVRFGVLLCYLTCDEGVHMLWLVCLLEVTVYPTVAVPIRLEKVGGKPHAMFMNGCHQQYMASTS